MCEVSYDSALHNLNKTLEVKQVATILGSLVCIIVDITLCKISPLLQIIYQIMLYNNNAGYIHICRYSKGKDKIMPVLN